MWDWLAQPLGAQLTLCLLHFLWQGVLVAAVAWWGFWLARRPQTRYAWAVSCLILMGLAPLATFAWTVGATTGRGTLPAEASAANLSLRPGRVADDGRETSAGPAGVDLRVAPGHKAFPGEAERAAGGGAVISLRSFSDEYASVPVLSGRDVRVWYQGSQPWLLAAWLGGVIVLALRLVMGAGGVWSLRRRVRTAPLAIEVGMRRLCDRMGYRGQLTVRVSGRVREALVVGCWRPCVLLPASWLTGLPEETLEMVLAHELAHVIRRDLWVNWMQRGLETALFYHPAVWWLSHRIRVERELCCDALAIAATGRRLAYARALEQVARRRVAGESRNLVAAIGGGREMNLLRRVQHALGHKPESRGSWVIGLTVLMVPLAIAVTSAALWAQEPKKEQDRPPVRRDREVEREVERDRAVERERKVQRDAVQRDRAVERAGDRPREDVRRDGDTTQRESDAPRRDSDAPRRAPDVRRDGDAPPRDGDAPRRDAPRDGDRLREGIEAPRVEGEAGRIRLRQDAQAPRDQHAGQERDAPEHAGQPQEPRRGVEAALDAFREQAARAQAAQSLERAERARVETLRALQSQEPRREREQGEQRADTPRESFMRAFGGTRARDAESAEEQQATRAMFERMMAELAQMRAEINELKATRGGAEPIRREPPRASDATDLPRSRQSQAIEMSREAQQALEVARRQQQEMAVEQARQNELIDRERAQAERLRAVAEATHKQAESEMTRLRDEASELRKQLREALQRLEKAEQALKDRDKDEGSGGGRGR